MASSQSFALFVLLISLGSFTLLVEAQKCFQSGSCEGNELVSFTKTYDENQCLFDCYNNTLNCNWYTINKDEGFCLQFRDCGLGPGFDFNCQSCSSGERTCDPDYQCNLDGKQCIGVSFDTVTGPLINENTCLNLCKDNNPRCNWFVFYRKLQRCVLYEDCRGTQPCLNDAGNATCTSGQRQCDPTDLPDNNKQKLFIFGGNTEEQANTTDIIDLRDAYICPSIPEAPFRRKGAFGTFIKDRVLICGGQDPLSGELLRDCWSFNGTQWDKELFSLPSARVSGYSIMLDDTHWWITGGISGTGYLSTTYVYNANTNIFSIGPNLPLSLGYHCIAQTDANTFLVLGGANTLNLDSVSSCNYISPTQFTCARESFNLPGAGRYGHFCGSSKYEDYLGADQVEAIISGGAGGTDRATYIWDTLSALPSWAPGPAHPDVTTFGSSVDYNNTFISLGGDSGDRKVYKYNPGDGSFNNQPSIEALITQSLSEDRIQSTAFLIPNYMVDCGEDNY